MITIKPTSKRYILFFILAIFLSSCGTAASPTPDLQATGTSLGLQETMVALNATVQAYSAAQTEAARPTATPLPTATLSPTPTVTPGPLVIRDDFSSNTGRWIECGMCRIEEGVLHMGPYPVSDKGQGYMAICADCGIAQDYKMGVDATFKDGYTDRGFGLILREGNGNYADVEITTWQVYGGWVYDKSRNSWGNLLGGDPWKLSGALYPSYGTNRLEVEVASQGGKSKLSIFINGQPINTTEMPAFSGRVGLVVGLHSLGVVFDNFYFEGYTTPLPANNNPDQQG
ncbi:MAG TPA: hypothetical protein VK249_04825 [Anaerolineales bacterium]|nr:hypothetical protein [Anaerolineales bacterium]